MRLAALWERVREGWWGSARPVPAAVALPDAAAVDSTALCWLAEVVRTECLSPLENDSLHAAPLVEQMDGRPTSAPRPIDTQPLDTEQDGQ